MKLCSTPEMAGGSSKRNCWFFYATTWRSEGEKTSISWWRTVRQRERKNYSDATKAIEHVRTDWLRIEEYRHYYILTMHSDFAPGLLDLYFRIIRSSLPKSMVTFSIVVPRLHLINKNSYVLFACVWIPQHQTPPCSMNAPLLSPIGKGMHLRRRKIIFRIARFVLEQ